MTHISQRRREGSAKNFCLEMLSNECFQGTRNAEPALSCCLVPGKPYPPGSWPAHGQPAGDPGPCPVPPPARTVQVSWDAPGDRAVRSHSHRLCLPCASHSRSTCPVMMSEGLQSIEGTFPRFSRNGRWTTKCQSSAGLKRFCDRAVWSRLKW